MYVPTSIYLQGFGSHVLFMGKYCFIFVTVLRKGPAHEKYRLKYTYHSQAGSGSGSGSSPARAPAHATRGTEYVQYVHIYGTLSLPAVYTLHTV